jgi:hypothetical protein
MIGRGECRSTGALQSGQPSQALSRLRRSTPPSRSRASTPRSRRRSGLHRSLDISLLTKTSDHYWLACVDFGTGLSKGYLVRRQIPERWDGLQPLQPARQRWPRKQGLTRSSLKKGHRGNGSERLGPKIYKVSACGKSPARVRGCAHSVIAARSSFYFSPCSPRAAWPPPIKNPFPGCKDRRYADRRHTQFGARRRKHR